MLPNHRIVLVFLITIIFTTANFAQEYNKLEKDSIKSDTTAQNPFFVVSQLPFQAPEFDKIHNYDYKPGLEEGMKQQLEEIQKIADNPEAPTFENTFAALEKSGQLLRRVSMVFNAITSANTNPTLQKVQEEEASKLAAHHDAIFLNSKLFDRVESVYQKLDELKLDNESQKLVKYYYDQFVHAGAKLSPEDKDKLKKLNEEEATLIAKFVNKLLGATKDAALVVDDKSDLQGMSPEEIDAARQAAEGRGLSDKWLITLQNTTQQPELQSLENRSIREKLFKNSWNRAEKNDENDTRSAIERIAKIRADKAKLLGFSNYAGWVLENQMAKTPDRVEQFLERLVPAAISSEQKEAADIQSFIDQAGEKIKLRPWDWNYYAEKLRRKRFQLDEDEIRSYFVLDNVLEKGVFYAAHELYGITFKEVHNYPVYQKDVRVFEVYDKDGSKLALFYGDYFKRDNKSGGAWMDNFVQQSKLLGTKPVVFNVTNFVKPAPGKPALLSYDDVTTLFNEFGHALHGIFANQEYPSISGTNVPVILWNFLHSLTNTGLYIPQFLRIMP